MPEQDGALLLAKGGLRPVAALWMPEDGMSLDCGFRKPDIGCLDPNIGTEGRQCG